MQDEQTLRQSAQHARDRAAAARQQLEKDTQRAQIDIESDINQAQAVADTDPNAQRDWLTAAETKRSELAREQEKTQQIIDAAEREAEDFDRQADAALERDEQDEKRRKTILAADIATRLANDNS